MRCAAVQMTIRDGEPTANVDHALDRMGRHDEGADLYVLPELFTTGYWIPGWADGAKASPAALDRLRDFARERGCALAFSILWTAAPDDVRNRMFFVGRDGEILGHYDKIHLFRLMDEHRHLQGGTALTVVPYEGFTFGLAVCYDLRFPVPFYRMALQGADVLLACAEWPLPRRDVMVTLARARAIETQSYVILSNRAGRGSDGTVFGGSSLVADPLGEGDTASTDGDAVVTGVLDRQGLAAVRGKIRVFEDRVPTFDL